MSIYMPKIDEIEIKLGLFVFSVSVGCSHRAPDKGPGIVTYHNKETGQYKIFFFLEGVETGLLKGSLNYHEKITGEEAKQFFEDILYDQKKAVKDTEEELKNKKNKLENSEKAAGTIDKKIKELS